MVAIERFENGGSNRVESHHILHCEALQLDVVPGTVVLEEIHDNSDYFNEHLSVLRRLHQLGRLKSCCREFLLGDRVFQRSGEFFCLNDCNFNFVHFTDTASRFKCSMATRKVCQIYQKCGHGLQRSCKPCRSKNPGVGEAFHKACRHHHQILHGYGHFAWHSVFRRANCFRKSNSAVSLVDSRRRCNRIPDL